MINGGKGDEQVELKECRGSEITLHESIVMETCLL
jgi:hypothetical protein